MVRRIAQYLESENPGLNTLVNVGTGAYAAPGGFAEQSLPVTVARILSVVFSLLGIIFVVLFVYAGFLYMTSQGNEQQVDKAKKIMTAAIIGLAIMLASYAIARFVVNSLQTATTAGI